MSSGDSAPPSEERVASVVPLVPAWRLDRTFDYSVPPELADRVARGSLVRVRLGGRNVRGFVTALADHSDRADLSPLLGVIFDVPLTPPPLDRLVEWVAARYVAPRPRAFARLVPPRTRVKVREPTPITGGPAPDLVATYDRGPELIAAIEQGHAGAWCLRVPPGEDRVRAIAELVAAAGRSGGAALVTVPEVAYGSVVLDGLERIWSEIARVDSARSDADRSAALLRLAAGHGLGGGGRSAVFAPAARLRLLVVDEEHHLSYKEERSPRYDARRVARHRARLQNAVVVFVDATPSMETSWSVISGQTVVAEPARVRWRAARPIVETIEPSADRVISKALQDRMRVALAAGRRVALLAPRRGFARAVWCAACRRSLRCEVCEAALTYARAPAHLRCPRCTARFRFPDECDRCGGRDFVFVGALSERLQEQLAKAFPDARVARVDSAALASERHDRGGPEPDIYVTTWIGTKEVLRPDVSVVGVLDIDWLIHGADFRSAENAYQALAEMAEWAGPAATGGRLVVQTLQPAHHAIQAVTRADHWFFVEREAELRRELRYPPFADVVRVRAVGAERVEAITEAADASAGAGGTVLGPVALKPRDAYAQPQVEILVKCAKVQPVADALSVILAEDKWYADLTVDVDPRRD